MFLTNSAHVNKFSIQLEEVMFKTLFATIAVTVMAFTTILAQPPGGPPERMNQRPGREEGMMKKLNFTDAQELQMKKMRIELMKKQTQLHSRIQTFQLDTKGLFLSDKVDRSAIEKNIKGISDAQEQIKLNFLDHWFAVNGILTTDQQKIWKTAPMEFEQRMHGRKGRMMEGREMMRGPDGPPDAH